MLKTKILRPSRLKTILLLIVSLAFVATTPITMEKNQTMSWLGAIFFGLVALVFIIQLFPNSSYLKLTEEGFEVKSMYKSHFTKWSDIEYFGVGEISNNKMVMFIYSENHNTQKIGKEIARGLTGGEGGLPNTYGMKADKLADLMNEWKTDSVSWERGLKQ